MKILYLANERSAAQLAANALHGIAPNVTLTWAGTPSPALRWLQDNRDAAALIVVDAEVQGQSCAAFVDQVRGLGVAAPVVVVAPEHLEASAAHLRADYVLNTQRLLNDLPPLVYSALRGTEPQAPAATPPIQPVDHSARQAELEERHATEVAAWAARLADNEAQHEKALTRTNRICTALQERLFELEAALRAADDRRASDAAAAAEHLAQRHAEFTASLTQARNLRTSEMAAAAERLARREAELGVSLADAVAARTAVEQELGEVRRTLQRTTAEGAAIEQARTALEQELAHVQAALHETTERATALEDARTALQEHLAQARRMLHEAAQRAEAERAALEQAAAERERGLDGRLAGEIAARETVEQELAGARTAFELARAEAVAARTAFEDELAHVRGMLRETTQRAAAERTALEQARTALEQQLSQVNSTLHETTQRAAADLAAAADRENALNARLAKEVAARETVEQDLATARAAHEHERTEAVAARTALEQELAQVQGTLHETTQRAAADLATAADRENVLNGRLAREVAARETVEQDLGAARAAHERERTEAVAARTALEQELAQVQGTLHETTRRAATDLAAAADRENALNARLAKDVAARETVEQDLAAARAAHEHERAEAVAARTELEQRLAQVNVTLHEVTQRATSDLAAAAARQAELDDRLSQEHSARVATERDLIEARTASARTRRRFLEAASGIRRRTREHRARLEAQLGQERIDHERALGAAAEAHRQVERARHELQRSLDATRQELQNLHDTHREEHQQHERARAAGDAELQRVSADYRQLRHSLDQLRAAFETLELVSSEHAAERSRLEAVVADRDALLSAQAARQQAAEDAARHALAETQARLRTAVETSSREIAALQRELGDVRQELNAARVQGDAWRSEADRLPALLKQIEETRRDNGRLFDRAPYGLCRCNADGAITHANRALVRLLGYRNPDELRKVDFAKAVFESPADLRWVIERAVRETAPAPIETAWRTRDRRRLVVRLQLHAASNGSVDIGVEDVTGLRAAEERLRQAQRIEAVGRVASEVAATCERLLADVRQNGHQWLAALDAESTLRYQGELMLGDITRAASFLRQLTAYGETQASTPEPASVQRVLRNLEPVLRRVAGDDIELVLPGEQGSRELYVDVDAERVERVLVNVASYARERMPHGGRLKIELSTTVVDRRFVATYPGVRPGAHVLITVTEARSGVRPDVPAEPRSGSRAADATPVSDKPGVDVGALLELIGGCGGHLWMAAEPNGNMTLKIQLPKRAGDLQASGTFVPPSNPGRALVRWFRH